MSLVVWQKEKSPTLQTMWDSPGSDLCADHAVEQRLTAPPG